MNKKNRKDFLARPALCPRRAKAMHNPKGETASEELFSLCENEIDFLDEQPGTIPHKSIESLSAPPPNVPVVPGILGQSK